MGKRLQQAQLAGAGDGFGAALHLEFVEDPAVVPFDGVQGQEKPLADLRFERPWVISFRISNSRWLSGSSIEECGFSIFDCDMAAGCPKAARSLST